MLSQQRYIQIINDTISEIQYPNFPKGLYQPIEYTMREGGKRLRPTLLLAANDAFGGDINECIWPAVGIEIFHNFTLVHDDVMDNADLRRGRPTVFKKWGSNAAILSGDAMVSMAYKCISNCPIGFLSEVIDKFGMMTMKVYEGQQIDEDFEKMDDVTMNQYINMIIGKTSALIAYPLAIGAIIAGANGSDIESIFNFGINLGIAFQMQDDYLDVYGNPQTFGKAIGGDILNDKKTWLRIIAKDKQPEKIKEAVKSNLSDKDKIDAVTSIYNELGLKDQGIKIISRYTNDAIDCLNETSMAQEAKDWFRDFAFKLVGRDK